MVSCYLVVGALLALSVSPAGPASMDASAVRIQDTVSILGQSVQSFEATLPPGAGSSNTTVLVTLNASARIVDASLNLTGNFRPTVVNMSGRGTTTDHQMQFGQGVDAADFNDDGFNDLAIGWAGSTRSQVIAGRGVEVYYGTAGPLTPRQFDWEWGPALSATCGFGHSITHGDYNNDGVDDLVAACGWEYWNGAPEVVHIFYGSSGGLPDEPSLNLTFNLSSPNSYGFGRGLAGHTDVDGNGYDDLVVSEPYYLGSTGRVNVFWGGASGLDNTSVTQITWNSSTLFGETLYSLGDTDGDGLGEFAVGAPDNGGSVGLAAVYEGVANSTALALRWSYSPSGTEYFGYSLAGGADLTGDGVSDLVVGAPFRINNGAVYVFAGGGNATYAASPTRVIDAQSGGMENLGIGGDIVGDIDADGLPDLVVSGNRYNTWDGRFYLYTAQNLSAGAAVVVNHQPASGTAAEEFGWRTRGVGDLNQDGFDEFAVTARSGINGSFAPGNVFLYYGSSSAFPEEATIYVDSVPSWNRAGALRGNATAFGLGPAIQSYIDDHQADADASGNIEVPLSFNFSGGGALNVSRISIRYSLVLPPVGVALTAPPEGRSLTVQWDLHATDGSLFTVWSNASGTWAPVGNQTLPRTDLTVTGLTDGVRYWFYVTETDPLGGVTSAPSAIVSGVPQDVVPPAMPRNFSLIPNPSNHSVALGWSANSDDTLSYLVFRRAGAGPNFTLVATLSHPTLAYTDSGLSEEVAYSYFVRAADPAGLLSAATQTLSVTIDDLTPPPVPQNVAAEADPSGVAIQVQWDANTVDTVRYDVLFGTVNDTAAFTSFGMTDVTSLSITGLNRDNTYYVAVQAIDKVSRRSGFSNVVAVRTTDTQAPAPPTLVSAAPAPTGNRVALSWTASDDDIDGFRVYRLDGSSWVEVASVAGGLRTVEVANLTDGRSYEFRLAAFDLGGRLGAPSNSLSATPADTVRPGAPPATDVEVVAAGRALTVTWTAPADPDVAGYRIYYLDASSAGGFELAATVGPEVRSWTQLGLVNGRGYSYEVAAFDEVPNESPRGPRVVGTPQDTVPPAAPQFDPHPAVTNSVTATLTGTAEPGTKVQVFLSGALRKSADADTGGRFTVEVILGPGENAVTAKAVDPDPAVAPEFKTSAATPVLHITLDTQRPTVTGRTPAENATNVDVGSRITLTFSEALAANSLSVELRDSTGNLAEGTLTLDTTGRTAGFVPSAPLAAGMDYTVVVAGIDLAGNPIASAPSSFRTAGGPGGGNGAGGLPGLEATAALAAIALAGAAAWAGRRLRRG